MNSNKILSSSRSSTATTGFAAVSTNVYHGPDSSNYAKVGSIGPNETVNILAKSMGWYHVEYSVGSTTQRKTGYVPESSLSNISGAAISEEDFYGGYCYATVELDVRTCDVFANTAPVGTLYKNEGCTFLFSYLVNGKNIAFIEYSSPSGTKRGYVYADYLKFTCETIVCVAKEKVPVYGTPDFTSSANFGTIYTNELMSLIAKDGNIIYVEYNTPKGRKRGYVDWNKVDPRDYKSGTKFDDFYITPTDSACHINDESIDVPVYGGPSTAYAKIGTVNCENITCFWTNENPAKPLTCIEYIVTTTGLQKRGYIDPSKVNLGLLALENNPLEDLSSTYTYFERIPYGRTQLNKEMVLYKTGNGPNHIFLTFALHGWEDGKKDDGKYYHGDGNMLVKMAKRFIQDFINLSESKRKIIQEKWTIFIFPGINLDGIVNGYSINSFGRCLYSGLDPNRNWGGNFQVDTKSPRYKTGNTYFGDAEDGFDAIELINLRNVIRANSGTDKNILIDVHGWLNQTIGSANIGKHFWNTFGIPSNRHSYSYGKGYLIAWAKNPISGITTAQNTHGIGAETCLLELPPTTNYSEANMNSYGDKIFNGTINVMEEITDLSTTDPYQKLYNQIQTIYNLAGQYKSNASVKEKNILTLEYLRKKDYDGASFDFLYGTIDDNFVSFVNNNSTADYLDPDNIFVPDSIYEKIKVSHLAACLNGYLYNPALHLGLNNECDALGCWAGDLIQIGSALEANDKDITNSEAYSLIGTYDDRFVQEYGFNSADQTGYGYADWTHDVDAVCIAEDLKNDVPIHTAFENFYSNSSKYNRKYHTFVEKTMPNGTNDRLQMIDYVKKFVNREMLTSWGFSQFITYNGKNELQLAVGFVDKLLYYYNKE